MQQISGTSGGDHFKVLFGDGRLMASDTNKYAASLREAADDEYRQVNAMRDFWKSQDWDEADQSFRGDFKKNISHADVNDSMSTAFNRAVDHAEDALHSAMKHLMRY